MLMRAGQGRAWHGYVEMADVDTGFEANSEAVLVATVEEEESIFLRHRRLIHL
jgi:hypothetical protein